ncbi:MAG: hypothetical protein EZS28_023115 [Streblomastix strix]|uniref:Uncharacterized protein n=1 Tax=Streblomastix strix TaxID=222440 RepID=A0A5J4VG55_9EUKA|nr:MAG: hypothetical protein EZS28_023115 [Streblomastix strix]
MKSNLISDPPKLITKSNQETDVSNIDIELISVNLWWDLLEQEILGYIIQEKKYPGFGPKARANKGVQSEKKREKTENIKAKRKEEKDRTREQYALIYGTKGKEDIVKEQTNEVVIDPEA